MDRNKEHIPDMQGWLLYDGSCGFCIEKLQAPWVREKLNLPEESLLDDIRILYVDGTVCSGADVYRAVMRRKWWLFAFYLISVMPIGKQIFDAAYKIFNRNRYRISKSCRL